MESGWTPLICSCWRKSGPLLCLLSVDSSGELNSFMIRETSDPETVQRNNWDVFSVKPISPPWPLAILLFCSCSWSMGIYDKSSAQQNIRFGTKQLLMDSPYQRIPCHEYGLGATLHSLCDLTQKKETRSKCCTSFFAQLEVSFTQWPHEYQIRELKLQGKRPVVVMWTFSLLLFAPKTKREKIDSFVKTLLTVAELCLVHQ